MGKIIGGPGKLYSTPADTGMANARGSDGEPVTISDEGVTPWKFLGDVIAVRIGKLEEDDQDENE